MYEPTWHRPTTTGEALAALAREGDRAELIAGGTDLAVRIADRTERPDVLVDLGRVPELSRIEVKGDTVALGATASHGSIAGHGVLRERAAVLAEACGRVGSPQIRSRGTVGGNVANASPAADASVALLALDAVAAIVSAGGPRRNVPLRDFWIGPGASVLRPAELLERVEFELPRPGSRSGYAKAGQRNALAIAIASVAVAFDPSSGVVRIALGSVAPTPVRADAAERLFSDGWPGAGDRRELLREVAERAVEATSCIDDVRATAEHRRRLTRVLVRRTLTGLCSV